MIGYVIILIIVVAFFYAIYSKMVEKEKTEEKTKAKHGEIKGYHSNGKLHYISNWKNGIQHGPIESYDVQGNLIKKSNLVNGEYQGEQIEYYPSGAIKTKRIYKNDEIVEEQEYDLLGNLKDKLDDENPDHITQMYLLRDKLNASKDEAEFNSIKQELINLIKDNSPKDSSGKHVSIAFIKEGGDMLDGIIMSDIEALEFKKKTSKEPSFNVSLTKESFYKMKESINSEFIENHQNDLDTVSIWIDSYKVNSEIPLAELIFLKVQLSLVLKKDMMMIIGDLNELMLNHETFKPNEGELGASLYETLSERNDAETTKEIDVEEEHNIVNLIIDDPELKSELYEKAKDLNLKAYEKYESGDYLEGIEIAKLVCSVFDASVPLDTLAEGYYLAKQYAKALETSDLAIKKDEDDNDPVEDHYFTRAKIHLALENINLAKKDFEKVLEIDSNHEEATKYLNQIN